jgi:uncharacterized protein YktB (UPF0637 family)
METFKCRSINPNTTDWVEISAEAAGYAAVEYHFRAYVVQETLKWRLEDGTFVYFACVEVEGAGIFITRRFAKGISRVGRKKPTTLEEIAKKLGWAQDPQELIQPEWEGEEESWS